MEASGRKRRQTIDARTRRKSALNGRTLCGGLPPFATDPAGKEGVYRIFGLSAVAHAEADHGSARPGFVVNPDQERHAAR
jgi:hypothetical protein